MTSLTVVDAGVDDAPALVRVIHAAFGARPRLEPPSTALAETAESVGGAIAAYGGLLALVDGEPAGAILFSTADVGEADAAPAPATDTAPAAGAAAAPTPAADTARVLVLRRVSVDPRYQRRGVATGMVGCAEEVAERRGLAGVRLQARIELPTTLRFWERRGYARIARAGHLVTLGKALPVEVAVADADRMRALGSRVAALLRAGDVVLLVGALGAGKTTFAQGVGAGLRVRGPITSPTFVISRLHPPLGDGPALVHVDAFRLTGARELDDLDLDATLTDAVTLVEWGDGVAEGLAADRLEVQISRDDAGSGGAGSGGASPDAGASPGADTAIPGQDAATADSDDECRVVRLVPVGARWAAAPPPRTLAGRPAAGA